MPPVKRLNREFLMIYNRNVDAVYRLCYSFMKNKADAEDLTQETFLKLLSEKPAFENDRHEKGWLIVTASNLCRDSLKSGGVAMNALRISWIWVMSSLSRILRL